MFPLFPFASALHPARSPSRRETRERELEARMSAFLAAKRDDASTSLINEIAAQRDALRGTRNNKTRTACD
ncbi:hypothetical protein [Roseibium sp.]|uniref:hypothetical protein n=1 Tax=Roseibium sp. TaxID=1936156 RepID=UPI003A97B2DB